MKEYMTYTEQYIDEINHLAEVLYDNTKRIKGSYSISRTSREILQDIIDEIQDIIDKIANEQLRQE